MSAERAGSAPGVDAASDGPFVGLVPYGEDDAAFFFGRDRETRIVAGNLKASPLTLLYGASGVGKTSLLRAGVVRDLHAELQTAGTLLDGRAPFAVSVFSAWRDEPLPALIESIRASAGGVLDGGAPQAGTIERGAVETLRAWTERVGMLLVILDQFEDYFTYHPDEDGPGTLAGELPGIVNDPDLHVHVLLSIREDALAKLDRFKGVIPRLFANYVRVPHLGLAAAQRAIEGPVQEWNRRFPGSEPYVLGPGLVDAVVDAATVGNLALVRTGTEAAASNGGERVEAPYLQLVMQRLWRETAAARSHDLTVATLEALGGPQRIVESHLLESLGALTEDEQAVAADLFRFLVTRSKTKIAHPVSDLVEWTGRSEQEVSTVLEKLCSPEGGRIMRRVPPPPSGGEVRFELFHDVLAEPILEWRRDHEQEARRRAAVRRFLRIGGALVAVTAIFAALGIWALAQRSDAQDATRSASSLALASSARVQLDGHVERSLLLGLEALREKRTPEATSAMVEALQVARSSGAAATLRGGALGVRAIAYSPDGSTLASADFDGALRLWDTQRRKPLGEPLVGHTSEVWGLSFSPDGRTLASASFDGTVRLWNVADGTPRGDPIDVDVGAVRSVAFSPDGRTLAFGGSDDTVRLWDVRAGTSLGRPLVGHRSSVWAVDISPDGRALASGGPDRSVRLWDLTRGGGPIGVLEGHAGTVASVDFSPDGRLLASSDLAGEVRLWDARTLEPLGAPLRPGSGQVWSVAFSPDGRTLAAAGYDGTVRSWNVRTREVQPGSLRGHARAVIAVAYASDGTLASASYDGTVRLWAEGAASPLGEVVGTHDDRVTTVAIAPDGRTLASGGFDRSVRLWDMVSGRALSRIEGDLDSVESVAVSPDGSMLAAADVAGSIWLQRVPDGAAVGRLAGHEDAVTSVAFTPEGGMLASGSADRTVRLWDLSTMRQIGEPLTGHESEVLDVAFSSDGRTLASSGSDGTLRLWNVGDRAPDGTLPLPEGEIADTLAFAPEGDTLASGSVGGSVRFWSVGERRQLGEPLAAHVPGTVEDVMFGQEGTTLVSAGSDGTVRLWDVDGRRQLGRPLRGHVGPVFGVAFAPDGRSFASGGEDTTVRLWEGVLWRDLADLESQVCGLVVRNFTRAEWDELVPGLAYRTTCPD